MEFHENFRYSINFDYECRFEEECTFCNEFVGNLEKTLFYQVIGNKVRSRILKETNNFVVIPTVGQIIEGYLLIMPKKHYLSVGHLPDSFYPELESLYYETKNILIKYYASPVFFLSMVLSLVYISVYEIDIIPSQYLRQLAAKAVDRLDKWNWRS